MNAEHDLDRRLTLVENETVHIYDLIDERTKRLAADTSEVRTTLAAHSVTLAEHSLTLAEHSMTLAEHGATLAEHGQQLDRIGVTLGEHGGLLTEILRRLPEPTV